MAAPTFTPSPGPTPSPTPTPTPLKGSIVDGRITDGRIVQHRDIIKGIEKGANFGQVHAIVVHQTDSATAASTLAAWKRDQNVGAHFLIDTDGTVTQTARVDQITYNVGKIRSRCMADGSCSAATSEEYKILHKKGQTYGKRVKNLNAHEQLKAYPQRYPTNDDSLAIELVGSCDKKAANIPEGEKCAYVSPTGAQNSSLTSLVNFLKSTFDLKDSDVYRHPTVSAKQSTEARDANWNYVAPAPTPTPSPGPTPIATRR